MPPEEMDRAIQSALDRLDEHENGNRKSSRVLLIALITALGGAGGTGVKTYLDAQHVDQLREVVATQVVEARHAAKERERLIEQVGVLREAVAGLRGTIEILASRRNDAREKIESVKVPEPIRIEPAPAPAAEADAIQAARKTLFKE
jgi:hypothetical protein